MKFLDYFLQNWRIAKARSVLKSPAFVLDIGTANGALFTKLPYLSGVGIDNFPKPDDFPPNAQYFQGLFPHIPALKKFYGKFDAAVLLAVMEHIPEKKQAMFVQHLYKAVKPNGLVVLTIPSPIVDNILDILKFLKLIDGMAEEEHYGFAVQKTIPLFERHHFKLVRYQKFQLGLNHFFVFTKK